MTTPGPRHEYLRFVAQRAYRQRVAKFETEAIADMRTALMATVRARTAEPFDPADWVLVCSPELWVGVDRLLLSVEIEGPGTPEVEVSVELLHHDYAPPWTLLLVRSVSWFQRNIPLPFMLPHWDTGVSPGHQWAWNAVLIQNLAGMAVPVDPTSDQLSPN